MIPGADITTIRPWSIRTACLVLVLFLTGDTSVRAQSDPGVVPVHPTDRPSRLGTFLEGRHLPGAWWTDGYSLRIQGSPLSGPLGRPPVVFLDGLQMPFSLLDRTNPGLLPVSTFDVDALSRNPGVQLTPAGRTEYGSFEFTTLRPAGTSIRGSAVLVNDTGDPGPNLYRDGGRNVDRSGPRASVRASINEGSWYVEGALDTDEHHMTDGRIDRRIWSGYDDTVLPVIRVLHPHVRLRYESADLLVDARAGRATTDDFMFVDPLAREWTNHQAWTWMSARAVRRIGADWTAGLSATGRDVDIESRSLPFEGPSPLGFRTGSARATLTRTWPTGTTSLHAGYFTEDAEQAARFDRVVESRGFAGLAWHRTVSTTGSVLLDARVSHPVDAPLDPSSASSVISFRLGGRTGPIFMAGGASLSSEYRQPVFSLSELAASGLDIGELGNPIVPAKMRTRERIAEAHFRISSALSGPGGASSEAVGAGVAGTPYVMRWLEVSVRRSQGLTVPDVAITHIRNARFRSDARFLSGIAGSSWQVGAGVDWRPLSSADDAVSGLLLGIAAYAHGRATQSDVFRDWYSGRPRYEARLDVGWSGQRIGVDLSSRVEGPGNWRMYARTPFARRPAQTRIDVAVWKRIAGDAALLTLGIRNVLDAPYRVHPAGIDEQLSVRVGMTVRINRTAQ